jgi:hypothetical protein
MKLIFPKRRLWGLEVPGHGLQQMNSGMLLPGIVTVLEVDIPRKRISLSMKAVPSETSQVQPGL